MELRKPDFKISTAGRNERLLSGEPTAGARPSPAPPPGPAPPWHVIPDWKILKLQSVRGNISKVHAETAVDE